MNANTTISTQFNLSNIPDSHQQEILQLLSNSKSDNTKLAYDSDWRSFASFCSLYNHIPIPANETTIVHYISELSKRLKYSTIERHIASISKAHQASRQISPTKHPIVIEALKAISRTKGNKETPKKALLLDDIRHIIDCIDVSTLSGLRDKALLLFGFASALRRSEIVSISYQDLTFTNEGLEVEVFESKTSRHKTVYLVPTNNDYCPITSLKVWLEASHINKNSIFRSINKVNTIGERLNDKTVANLVKKYTELAGLDPSLYAGHSLRSGHITSAHDQGYDLSEIRQHTGHSSIEILDRSYIQRTGKYNNNTSSILSKL